MGWIPELTRCEVPGSSNEATLSYSRTWLYQQVETVARQVAWHVPKVQTFRRKGVSWVGCMLGILSNASKKLPRNIQLPVSATSWLFKQEWYPSSFTVYSRVLYWVCLHIYISISLQNSSYGRFFFFFLNLTKASITWVKIETVWFELKWISKVFSEILSHWAHILTLGLQTVLSSHSALVG